MKVAVVKERYPGEFRVALLPDNVEKLKAAGYDLMVERGAGVAAAILDSAYESAGAQLVDRAEITSADILLQVRSLGANPINGDDDLELMHPGQIVIGMCDPLGNAHAVARLAKQGVSQVALEMIPRITRAQSMDVLSSQANLAGYRSVIDAAEKFGKAFPMMMTAAGRVNPAKVMILGVGVAGLQAIATAKRLGAVVSATDVRSATKEQVESLGGKFIMVEDEESREAETVGGYAKEMSDQYKQKQAKLIAETVSKQDIVISTALIPGRPAPILITEEMVNSMAQGSVIVDLAVEAGGNCPLSKIGEVVVHNGVKILGYANVPGRVAKDASSLYAKNIVNFLYLMINKEEKKIDIDWNDEIINAVVLSHNGNIKLEQFF